MTKGRQKAVYLPSCLKRRARRVSGLFSSIAVILSCFIFIILVNILHVLCLHTGCCSCSCCVGKERNISDKFIAFLLVFIEIRMLNDDDWLLLCDDFRLTTNWFDN
ncbi:putative transcriptional regulatory protein [Trichinella spiralis]|uniref:Transcriptional regulatory protein n=1 Tax=Trichinella spiralis TaxID=6334 RepID=A0ABR3L444_TRISP